MMQPDSTNLIPPTILQAHTPGTRFKDPPGAQKWYKRKDSEGIGPMQQMLQHADLEGHTFRAACDYWSFTQKGVDGEHSHTVVKMYASFPTAKDFLVGTLLESEARFMYELIPKKTPCKFHLDVEGTCSVKEASEPEATLWLTELLKLLRGSCKVSLDLYSRLVCSIIPSLDGP